MMEFLAFIGFMTIICGLEWYFSPREKKWPPETRTPAEMKKAKDDAWAELDKELDK